MEKKIQKNLARFWFGARKTHDPHFFTKGPHGDFFLHLRAMWIKSLWVLYRRKKNVMFYEKLNLLISRCV
jgi:hypothetical protein